MKTESYIRPQLQAPCLGLSLIFCQGQHCSDAWLPLRRWLDSKNSLWFMCECMPAKLLQSCLTLCYAIDCSPPGFSIHGILQTEILERVAISFSRGYSWSRDRTHLLHLLHWQVGSLPLMPPGFIKKKTEVAQSCWTLCDPMDCSPPSSSVHGIFQARVLEWVAISFSRGSSQPRDQIWVSCIASRHFTIWATMEAPWAQGTSLMWYCRWDILTYLIV